MLSLGREVGRGGLHGGFCPSGGDGAQDAQHQQADQCLGGDEERGQGERAGEQAHSRSRDRAQRRRDRRPGQRGGQHEREGHQGCLEGTEQPHTPGRNPQQVQGVGAPDAQLGQREATAGRQQQGGQREQPQHPERGDPHGGHRCVGLEHQRRLLGVGAEADHAEQRATAAEGTARWGAGVDQPLRGGRQPLGADPSLRARPSARVRGETQVAGGDARRSQPRREHGAARLRQPAETGRQHAGGGPRCQPQHGELAVVDHLGPQGHLQLRRLPGGREDRLTLDPALVRRARGQDDSGRQQHQPGQHERPGGHTDLPPPLGAIP